MKEIKNLFNKGISYGYSPYEVFDDFLNVVVISLINATNGWGKRFQEYEQQFKSIIDRYDGKVDLFCEILACFVGKMESTKETYKDWIGEYFMQEVSHGEHGQYFTPDHIAKLCAETTVTKQVQEKVRPTYYDCACGSSRMLLQAQTIKRGKSYGTDIDRRCVLMSVFNHFFYGLCGEFTVGNDLMYEVREVFKVVPPFIDHYINDGKDKEVKVVEKEKKSEVIQVGLF